MFDSSKHGRGPVGSSRRTTSHIMQLEKLEDRAVPAVIGGIVYQDTNQDGLWQTSEQGIANTA